MGSVSILDQEKNHGIRNWVETSHPRFSPYLVNSCANQRLKCCLNIWFSLLVCFFNIYLYVGALLGKKCARGRTILYGQMHPCSSAQF